MEAEERTDIGLCRKTGSISVIAMMTPVEFVRSAVADFRMDGDGGVMIEQETALDMDVQNDVALVA